MAAEVIYKPAAEAEIEIAFREYEAQQSGLGTQFLDELSRIEGHLRLNPAIYGGPSCVDFPMGSSTSSTTNR